MAFIQKDKIFSKRWIINYTLIILGAFILAAGFVLFITPYKIVPGGGVYGIAIIIHYLIGSPVGLTALFMDVPLTIIGIKVLGPRFGYKTVVGFLLTAFFCRRTYLFIWWSALVPDEPLLSAIFGGVFLGTGLGMIFKSKATSGGTDIVAMIISKHTHLPVGQLLIYVDSAIVLIGLLVFQDWRIPLYSLIVIYITGKVIDTILQGGLITTKLCLLSAISMKKSEQKLLTTSTGGAAPISKAKACITAAIKQLFSPLWIGASWLCCRIIFIKLIHMHLLRW